MRTISAVFLIALASLFGCSSDIPPSTLLVVQQPLTLEDQIHLIEPGGSNRCTASPGTLLEVLGTKNQLVLVVVRRQPEYTSLLSCMKDIEGFISSDAAQKLHESAMNYHQDQRRSRNAYAAIKDSRK